MLKFLPWLIDCVEWVCRWFTAHPEISILKTQSLPWHQEYTVSFERYHIWLTLLLNWNLKTAYIFGKMSVNGSILDKNQEICNKTNLWKFQLISLFLLRENSKNAFSIFVFIIMAGVFVSRDENSLLDLISLIIRKRQHISQKYFKESFLPSLSLYNVSYV